jgi:hypothetical protein
VRMCFTVSTEMYSRARFRFVLRYGCGIPLPPSLGDWFPKFRDNVVASYSRVKISKKAVCVGLSVTSWERLRTALSINIIR